MSTFLCGFNNLRKFKYDGNEIFWKYYFAHFKMFKVISRGPDNTELISTYQSRNNPKYLSSLGQAIVEIARRVPDGLLVSDLKAHSHLMRFTNRTGISGIGLSKLVELFLLFKIYEHGNVL